jgi:hypothetical protein
MSQAICEERSLVDRHFRGRISPEQEQRLRSHLPDCASCRARYDRHLLNNRLAGGLNRVDRLAIGLGLPRLASPTRRWATSHLSVLGVAAAAAVLLLVIRPGAGPSPIAQNRAPAVVPTDGSDQFTARGGTAGPATAPSTLHLYRVDQQGAQVAVGGWIQAADELAFAYGNPGGFRRLAVFGADDSGKIYWFFPAWTDPREDPLALPIEKSAHRELPEAIGHVYRGRRLRVVGLFLNQAVSVRTIEKHVRKGDFDFSDLDGVQKVETTLEIRR